MQIQTSHRRSIAPARRALLLLSALAVALLALPAPRAEGAPGDKLIGKWSAVKMVVDGKDYPVKPPRKILFQYKTGGKFVVVMAVGSQSRTLEGTWKATADKVTMTVKGKTEVAPYKITGNKLKMTKTMAGKKIIYYMQRTN